jgi:hypothetical protein
VGHARDVSEPGRRDVDLPDGRRLVVRPATRDDVPGLVALFEGLGPEDRHRRFFSGFRPDDEFVGALVDRPADRAGMLVVEVASGDERAIVAEAEYGLQEDGDGELAITVERGWRGWLAPYLLDALVELAGSRGVGNLRAEVLVQNRPMLALVQRRPHASMETGDPTLVDAVIATAGGVPSWPPVRRGPRVLVEVPGAHWRLAPTLLAAGVDVVGCSGPSRQAGGCPLLHGEHCPLVDGADVVVHALGGDDPQGAALLDAHAAAGTRHLVVDVTRGRPDGQLPPGAAEVERPTAEEVRSLVASLLDLAVDDRQEARDDR